MANARLTLGVLTALALTGVACSVAATEEPPPPPSAPTADPRPPPGTPPETPGRDRPSAGHDDDEPAPTPPSTAAPPVVRDEELCRALDSLIVAAPSGFAAQRGRLESNIDGDRSWTPGVTLPAATQCAIWKSSDGETYFRCSLASGDGEAVEASLAAWRLKLQGCLPGWAQDESETGPPVVLRQVRWRAPTSSVSVKLQRLRYVNLGKSDLRVRIGAD